MEEKYRILLKSAAARYRENKKYFRKLKKMKPGQVDPLMMLIHNEVSQEIDCRDCANCCSITGPLLRERDISRLAKALRMKPGTFTETYLTIDEEEDYVFRCLPCPFLGRDRHCTVYENRPGACRDYPHTDRLSFRKYAAQMLENTRICPVVYLVFERMREKIPC